MPKGSSADLWPQLQGNAKRSGNAPHISLSDSIGLLAAIPLSDGVYASPIIGEQQIFVMDGAGVLYAIDRSSFQVDWKFATRGGVGNCNNVAAPAIVGNYVHVATTAGFYYILDREKGSLVKEIDCGEPIFSSPAVGNERVYFTTLGAQVYAIEPSGEVVWTWDFVKEVIGFTKNRWSGADWSEFRKDRVTWRDHFVCSRNICLVGDTVVIPAGGRTIFLEDKGDAPNMRTVGEIPAYAGSEYPATLGQSADDAGYSLPA